MSRVARLMIVLALASSCSNGGEVVTPSSTAEEPTSSTVTSSTVTSSTVASSSSTTVPLVVCDRTDVHSRIADVMDAARLTPALSWGEELTGRYADRAVDGAEFASRLGLDCGVAVGDNSGERLLVAAWTGPRMAFVVLDAAAPSSPYAMTTVVTIITEDIRGEMLRDDYSVWAGSLADATSVIIGHVDFNLGATAKAWQTAVPRPDDGEPTLPAERDTIAALRAAGGRNVAIAQPAEFGSTEGIVMLISPGGQILLFDAAPVGDLDPLVPRYLDGVTTVETYTGVDLRVTTGEPDEYTPVATEVGFTCGAHAWILEPPMNGTGEEMVAFARHVLDSGVCD